MQVTKIDHLVLTVLDIEQTKDFYQRVLGMKAVFFGDGRVALRFGEQKINLHRAGSEIEPKATYPLPGSADICFITETELKEAMQHVENQGVEIIEGPVTRTGANGSLLSFYFRDPSGNLVEVANEMNAT